MTRPVSKLARSIAPLLLGLLAACAGPRTAPPPGRATSELLASETASGAGLLEAAEAAYAAQDWAAAERDYLALARQNPTNGQPVFKLGNLYTRTSRLDQAANAYAEAVKRDPALTRAWHNLGVVQLRLARKSLAEAASGGSATEADATARARKLVDGIDALLAAPISAAPGK